MQRRRVIERIPVYVGGLCWAYLATAVVLWLTIRLGADRWWLATLIAYGPRWVWIVPAFAVLPAVLWLTRARWRMGGVAALAGLIVLFGVMGFRVPFPLRSGDGGRTIRVLSFNADGFGSGVGRFVDLIAQVKPDFIAIQESGGDPALAATLGERGWHVVVHDGQTAASKFPVVRTDRILSLDTWRTAAVHYTLRTPFGEVVVATVHLDTPRHGFTPVLHREAGAIVSLRRDIDYRRQGARRAAAWIAGFGTPAIVAGDFNMPTDSAIFRECWATPYTDSFLAAGFGLGNTKFTKLWGVRIDHVLVGPGWHVRRCRVGPDIGSDHCPLIAELEYTGAR